MRELNGPGVLKEQQDAMLAKLTAKLQLTVMVGLDPDMRAAKAKGLLSLCRSAERTLPLSGNPPFPAFVAPDNRSAGSRPESIELTR